MSPWQLVSAVVMHGGRGPVSLEEYLSLLGVHLVGFVGLGLLIYWLLVGRAGGGRLSAG